MRDLDKALADIIEIRSHIAAETAFRGYGPTAIAVSGVLAFVAALAQTVWLADPTAHPFIFFGAWIAVAFVCAALVWVEMRSRSRRHHSGLADAMVYQAIEQFLPAAAAGAVLAAVLGRDAPQTVWMLPGLWQVLVSLGIFASARSLPRAVRFVGLWYAACGFCVLTLASQDHALSPWGMGLPFVVGQLMMAAVIHHSSGENDGDD